jgi:RNA polymerase sigma-70 factor (ECF subfamily)
VKGDAEAGRVVPGHGDSDGTQRGLASALSSRSDVCDADLDDFAQEAVLRVIDRLDAFRGDSRFTTWAMAVAVRVSLTALRRHKWTTEPLDDKLNGLAAPIVSSESSSAANTRGELLAALRTAIAEALTPRQRQIMLAELDGIPQVTLADRLSSTPGAIYKTSHDARKRLKAALTRAGFDAQTARESLANEG